MLLEIFLLMVGQGADNATPAERKGIDAILHWKQCASDETSKIIASTESAEALADVVISQCAEYEAQVRDAWFPLYAALDIREAGSDTDEAVQRIKSQIRGSVLSQVVYSRLSKSKLP